MVSKFSISFDYIPKSMRETWKKLLDDDPSFPEELAKAFADWLKVWGNPVKGYWDAEKVFLNTRDLTLLGLWKKFPFENFVQVFGSGIDPGIFEVVRQSILSEPKWFTTKVHNREVLTSLLALVMTHGGRILPSATKTIPGTGMYRKQDFLQVTIEVPTDAAKSFELCANKMELLYEDRPERRTV